MTGLFKIDPLFNMWYMTKKNIINDEIKSLKFQSDLQSDIVFISKGEVPSTFGLSPYVTPLRPEG